MDHCVGWSLGSRYEEIDLGMREAVKGPGLWKLLIPRDDSVGGGAEGGDVISSVRIESRQQITG